MFWLTIFINFAVLSSLVIADDPCRFQDPKNGVIDLTSLGRTDGKAAYADKIPPTGSNYKYSYNPCKPFNEEPACKGVAVCQISMDGKFSFSLGSQDSVKWSPGAGLGASPTISYSAGDKKVTVTLQCAIDGTNELEALGEPTTNNYKFILTNKCACWDGCGDSPTTVTTTTTFPTPPPQRNCSINGSVYTSDKQVIQSFPFHVSINPSQPQQSSPRSSYAVVDMYGSVIELNLVNIVNIPPALFCLQNLQALSLADSINLSIPPEILRLGSTLKSFTAFNISKSLFLPPALFGMTLLSTLSIVNCGLETIPEDIVYLSNLIELTLDQNQLVTLPATLGQLPSLTSLSVNNNLRLFSLDFLNGLKSLTTLRGSNCAIDHLPNNIYNLRTIEMNENQLTSLDGLETITSVSSDSFSFRNNKITSISTGSLDNIESLQYLDLSSNLLTTLPDSLYRIKNLQTLDIHNNNFNEKETEWIQGLFRLTNTTIIM
ncbi:unnamed protein product [Rotaria sp. Silwood2]|nr:unnamed protein product [Rotaria sp. Silwood2]CAF3119623.1 unnamed protein product [Rotaria sp. Silwood2]CAF4060937.1 unnamed protein product [Rotaria sp. Silwood2]